MSNDAILSFFELIAQIFFYNTKSPGLLEAILMYIYYEGAKRPPSFVNSHYTLFISGQRLFNHWSIVICHLRANGPLRLNVVSGGQSGGAAVGG